jgi:cysteine desulfurase family protein (TIGR01976 family)
MQMFDPYSVRHHFPALNQVVRGSHPVFLDGPGGTQVPQMVLDAMVDYLGHSNSNLLATPFFAVERTHGVVKDARSKAAAFVNGQPDNIVFGSSMTTLTSQISRAISTEWQAGDEIIVSDLDHYSNVSFWRRAAADRGVTCHTVRVDTDECTFDYDHYESLLSPKTKLVAFTLAANICGSRTDAHRIIKAAKSVGAMTYVDSVHAAPHFLPDVQDLDCDFLACSVYKFCGPHLAFVHGRADHLARLPAYKVEPASELAPEKWETGTKSFEALAGLNACIDYLASGGSAGDLRARLKSVYSQIISYEQEWSRQFLVHARKIEGMKIYGITDPARVQERSPTFAFTIKGRSSADIANHLAWHNIGAGAGHFYARGVTDALGLTESGGLVRVGCVHYNTLEELERLFAALKTL